MFTEICVCGSHLGAKIQIRELKKPTKASSIVQAFCHQYGIFRIKTFPERGTNRAREVLAPIERRGFERPFFVELQYALKVLFLS